MREAGVDGLWTDVLTGHVPTDMAQAGTYFNPTEAKLREKYKQAAHLLRVF